MSQDPMFESRLSCLPLLHRGKVRDNYAIGNDRLLIVATDRLSAFDVVMPDPMPGKGRVLTAISNFWFARTRHLVPNHLTGEPLEQHVPDAAERAPLEGRAVVVKRLRPLPVEAVVRGYLIGSGWKDYQRDGAICFGSERSVVGRQQNGQTLFGCESLEEGDDRFARGLVEIPGRFICH